MYLKHGLVYLLAKLAPTLASFVILAAYTRWMTKEDYGIYTTVLVVAYSFNGFMFGWLYVGIMRFWNDQNISIEAVQRLITASVLAISLVIGMGSLLFGAVTDQMLAALGFWGVFSSLAFYEAFQRINSITQHVNRYLWAEVIRTVLTTLAGLLFVWLGYSAAGAMGAMVLGVILVLSLSGAFYKYFLISLRNLDMRVLKELLNYGVPLSLSLVFMETIQAADRVLIGWISGYADAGQYAVAYNIPSQIIMMITGSLNLAAYPLIIHAMEKESQAAAEDKMKHYFLVLVGVSIPALFGLVGVAPIAMNLLVGPEFIQASIELLPWISIAILIKCIYLFHTALAFQLAKRITASLWITALAAVVNVALNVILIPLYGLFGATLASILAYSVCLVGGYVFGNKLFALHIPWLDTTKVLLASAGMYVFMQQTTAALHIPVVALLLKIVVGVLSYAAIIWIMNVGNVRALLKSHNIYFSRLLSAR